MASLSNFRFSKKTKIFSGIALGLCLWFLFEEFAEDILCREGEKIIECAYRHPSVRYYGDYQNYPVLDEALKEVNNGRCNDIEFLTATLAVGIDYTPRNAHYSEEIVETVDKLLATNPKCFLKAVAPMKKKVRARFAETLRSISTHRESLDSEGIATLEKFSNLPEYREVISDLIQPIEK